MPMEAGAAITVDCAVVATPGLMMKAADEPDCPPPVAVIVCEPDVLSVMECEGNPPLTKAALGPAPAPMTLDDVSVTLPMKAVCVLPKASIAVIPTLKGPPAVCVAIGPPPTACTLKLASAPGLTSKIFDVPVSAPAVLV